MTLIAILAAVFGLALAGGGGGGSAGSYGVSPDREGFAKIQALGEKAGLPKDWQAFFVFVAYGESRGNNLVGLGRPSMYPPFTKTHQKWVSQGRPPPTKMQKAEAAAAAKAYNWVGWLPKDAWPKSGYTFGSGGWFAFLPVVGLRVFRGTPLVRLHPFTVFDGPSSFVMAMGFARRLFYNRDHDGTVLAMRAGWGRPAKMDDPQYLASKRAKYESHLKALGISTAFLDHKLSPFPSFDPVQMFQHLGGWMWLPEDQSA